MTFVDERMYRFQLPSQWGAGVRRGLRLCGDRLVVPVQLAVEPIPGTGVRDGAALPAVDGCGHLMWVRPRSGELARRPLPGSRGVVELGTLDGPGRARRILAGRTLIWVVTARRLDRYGAATLQRLSPVEARPGWRFSDAAGDGEDGLWLTEVDASGRWQVRHVDCWGRSCRLPVDVPGPAEGELAIAATGDAARLVVMDPVASSTACVLDALGGAVVGDIGLDPVHHGRPTLLTAAWESRIHLLTVLADTDPHAYAGQPAEHAVYEALDLAGAVEDHQQLELPPALGRPTALVSGAAGLVVAGTRGLGDITPRQGVPGGRRSTFITPALVSPLGPSSGWRRAEIDVVLPVGTAMDVTWAATDDVALTSRAAAVFDAPATAGLVDELDELLPWRGGATVTYRGTGIDPPLEQLAALLGDVEETTLWLRIRLHTPPGRTPPELAGLRVRYPDASYLDHLPAVYREQPSAAGQLRQILAPYEVLFDGLDETLTGLADRLDPAAAGDGWTDYLLSWLGFPPLGDLPDGLRRGLLEQAARVLELRGTRRGLQLLLDVVTQGRARVTDSAEEPAGWFLGRSDDVPSVGAAPARLGLDTIAVAQRPAPSRPGTMVLGRTPLGHGCPDPGLVLAERASTVLVELELDHDQQQVLAPIIDRLLSVFVPAHCRLQVLYTGADAADRTRRLDVDFRLGPQDAGPGTAAGQGPYDALLHSDAHWRLGATTRLGGWPLPEGRLRSAVLDHGALLGAGPRLQ